MSTFLTAREIGRLWFENVWNQRDKALARELMAEDAVGHLEGGREIVGSAGFLEFQATFLGALPDLHIEVVDTLADGDAVCVHWKAHGPRVRAFAIGRGVLVPGRYVVSYSRGQDRGRMGFLEHGRGGTRGYLKPRDLLNPSWRATNGRASFAHEVRPVSPLSVDGVRLVSAGGGA